MSTQMISCALIENKKQTLMVHELNTENKQVIYFYQRTHYSLDRLASIEKQ